VTNLELGTARGSATVANSLAFLTDAINALGFSPWNDNTANATYDEFRLWDGALAPWALQGLHEQGADNTAQADTDADKMPDAFEKFYFGNPTAELPGTDFDGDLSSNLEEMVAGSNPNDSSSSPNDSDADGLPDAWEIGHFGDLDENAGTDPDGDFAFNDEELAAGTDPSLYTDFPDSDSDGMSDGWETSYFLGLQDNGTGDDDGDLSNSLAEFTGKSDPLNPLSPGVPDGDADNDSLPDRWEITTFSATSLATQTGGISGHVQSDGCHFDPDRHQRRRSGRPACLPWHDRRRVRAAGQGRDGHAFHRPFGRNRHGHPGHRSEPRPGYHRRDLGADHVVLGYQRPGQHG
jgi:hypothetical protein